MPSKNLLDSGAKYSPKHCANMTTFCQILKSVLVFESCWAAELEGRRAFTGTLFSAYKRNRRHGL